MTSDQSSDKSPAIKQSRLAALAGDIKLSHSVFALPFALLGAYLAAGHDGQLLHERWGLLGLIVLCMFFARTLAMTVNRLADHRIDQRNPRTAGRAIPSGRLSFQYVLIVTILCAIGFAAATSGFWWLDHNPWPLILCPIVIVWLSAYSFIKRFSWMCHLFLGSALAISPLAAGIAIDPSYLALPTLWLLGLMVLGWVAGFDVIYALQDRTSDLQEGLHSIPTKLNVKGSLWVSRLLHLLSVGALVGIWQTSPMLQTRFAVGIAMVVMLLVVEHWLARKGHLEIAFFMVNGIISLLLGGLGIWDVIQH